MTRPRLFFEEVVLRNLSSHCPSLFDFDTNSLVGVIGIDEVGRGCLAGPVVAGISLWLRESVALRKPRFQKQWLSHVADSKKLSYEARAKAFAAVSQDFSHLSKFNIEASAKNELTYADLAPSFFSPTPMENLGSLTQFAKQIRDCKNDPLVCVGVEIGAADASEIDDVNIWGACQLAMARALRSASKVLETNKVTEQSFVLVVDGKLGVRVPKEFASSRQLTAIAADDKFVSVGLASIAAKVVRDSYMELQAKQYPEYAFEKHKGYATVLHREALDKFSSTPLHRRSFLKNIFNCQLVEDEGAQGLS